MIGRDYIKTRELNLKDFSEGTTVMAPFSMVEGIGGKPFPVWLSKEDRLANDRLFLLQGAYGKPMPNQTLESFRDADAINMVGLYEVMDQLPDGDAGEAYWVKMKRQGQSHYGIWADSKGAARKFITSVFNALGLAEAARTEGFSEEFIQKMAAVP